MTLPLSAIVKELEQPDSIIPIAKSLHFSIKQLHLESKLDLNHLVSRTINLIQSHLAYNKWCGVTVLQILIDNYEILSTNGLKFINSLIKVLETTNANTNLKLFNAVIECLNKLCDQIRGKPTLTREILTPKLSPIIQLYMNNIELNPCLIIKSLTKIMSHHPTTFRPFGNKLNSKLIEFIRSDFVNYPTALKHEICKCFAQLPIIEKSEPEAVWNHKLTSIINEIIDLLNIFKDLVDINQDEELIKSLSNPAFRMNNDNDRLLEYLQIDLSSPETLLHLSNNLEVLLLLLIGFIVTDTKFCVRLPIGKFVSLVGIIFGFNTNYLPIKRDIRDEATKALINTVLVQVQDFTLNVIDSLVTTYQNPVIMYLNDVLSILETSIPMNKKVIDSQAVLKHESFMIHLLNTISKLLGLVLLYQEPQQVVRFVDMALILVEPRTDGNQLYDNGTKPNSAHNGVKKSKKKNHQTVPMADLLSHSHLFDNLISPLAATSVRSFVNSVITRMELPLAQYYKIMRYIIIEAVQSVSLSHNNLIPSELKDLLINAVVYPGFEKVSVLPIVSSILGSDPLLSIFNNPRFPPLPVLIKKAGFRDEDEDEEGDDGSENEQSKSEDLAERNQNYDRSTVLSNIPLKRPITEDSGDSNGTGLVPQETKKVKIEASNPEPSLEIDAASQDSVMKFSEEPTSTETIVQTEITNANGGSSFVPETIESTSKPDATETTQFHHQKDDANTLGAQNLENNDNDSDFEMPAIDINDDSDEE